MPYKIKKVKDGYKVCKKNKPSKCFSKKGMSKDNAKKQMAAIAINEKSYDNSKLYSWITPNGKIIPVPSNKNHLILGKKFLKQHYNKIASGQNIYYELFKLGWCRVTYYGLNVYINSTKKPSQRQINEIIDAALLAGKLTVSWDNEEDEITLWDKLQESRLQLHKYSVTDINIRGKIYNLYPHAADIKDALRKATYHILKDQNMSVEKEFGRIFAYLLENYYAGYIAVTKLPEQGGLFDHTMPSFKDIFYEGRFKPLMKTALMGAAMLGTPAHGGNLSNNEVANLWSKYYQSTNNPQKEKRALNVLANFDGNKIPNDAKRAIQTAIYIFGGDMGVSSETLEQVLLATGAIESNFQHKSQIGSGPAMSYWQVEPETAIDLLINSRSLFGPKFKKVFGNDADVLLNMRDKSPKNLAFVKLFLYNKSEAGASFAAAKWIVSAHSELKNHE